MPAFKPLGRYFFAQETALARWVTCYDICLHFSQISPMETIGKYRVIRELGKGATATVYLCDDPDSGRQVAVKVIQFGKDGGAMSRRMRKLFQNEGMVSRRLNHPNIVQVYEAVVEADFAYLAMEYVKGFSLEEHTRIDKLLPTMPRAEIIAKSLTGRGALILTKDMEEACAISNRIAPEHLEVSSTDPHRWEPLLRHAGAIFLGAYTSESLGDYCAGPNHVLPTSGTARFSSPLGVYDFQKRSSLIEVSEAGAQVLGKIAAELAYGEGLQAHAQAAEMRLKKQG